MQEVKREGGRYGLFERVTGWERNTNRGVERERGGRESEIETNNKER
jgi:hypothetical protein